MLNLQIMNLLETMDSLEMTTPLKVLDHPEAKPEPELVEVQPENPILVLIGKEKPRGHAIKTDCS